MACSPFVSTRTMSYPPAFIQQVLLRESIRLLASYSWQETVVLESSDLGSLDEGLTLAEFLREFRLRHAIATARLLPPIVQRIEAASSHVARIERAESRGAIRGRLDTNRYLARRATLRSLPRRYPIVRNTMSFDTPENMLTKWSIEQVRSAMRDSPFDSKSAETAAATMSLRWATRRLERRPWVDIAAHGLPERLYHDVDTRIRRRQTGNDDAYRQMLNWYHLWTVDLDRLGFDATQSLVHGLLALPAGEAFWDKVFEVWCLGLVARTLDNLGWTRIDGPIALHRSGGVVFRYQRPDGCKVSVRFQRKEPLPAGRWVYRDRRPMGGIPDVSLSEDENVRFPLLIDAKNRFVRTDRAVRPEETYKMLGYAENFRPPVAPQRFSGVLIFPSAQSGGRILDGPEQGRIDLIFVDLAGERAPAIQALGEAITAWASPISELAHELASSDAS